VGRHVIKNWGGFGKRLGKSGLFSSPDLPSLLPKRDKEPFETIIFETTSKISSSLKKEQ
jgi:hypothetical protein